MSTLRRRLRIVLDGVPHEITTNMLDSLDQRKGDESLNAALRPLHKACLRLDIEGTPKRFEDFAAILDDMDDLEPPATNGSEPDDVDPTQPAVSAG